MIYEREPSSSLMMLTYFHFQNPPFMETEVHPDKCIGSDSSYTYDASIAGLLVDVPKNNN